MFDYLVYDVDERSNREKFDELFHFYLFLLKFKTLVQNMTMHCSRG